MSFSTLSPSRVTCVGLRSRTAFRLIAHLFDACCRCLPHNKMTCDAYIIMLTINIQKISFVAVHISRDMLSECGKASLCAHIAGHRVICSEIAVLRLRLSIHPLWLSSLPADNLELSVTHIARYATDNVF